MLDCRPNIRCGKSRQSRSGAGRRDWPDESKAPASIHRPNEGPQGRVTADGFGPRGPAPLKSSGKDNGASAQVAVPAVVEYREKFAEGLALSGRVQPRCRQFAGGKPPGSALAPD